MQLLAFLVVQGVLYLENTSCNCPPTVRGVIGQPTVYYAFVTIYGFVIVCSCFVSKIAQKLRMSFHEICKRSGPWNKNSIFRAGFTLNRALFRKKRGGPRAPNTIIGLLLPPTVPSITSLPDCLHTDTQSCHFIEWQWAKFDYWREAASPTPPARGSGERCKLPQRGSGRTANACWNHPEEHRKRIWRQ